MTQVLIRPELELEGTTPDVVGEFLDAQTPAGEVDLQVRLWDPSTQLRYRRKASVPVRPDGAPNRAPAGWGD